MKTCTQSSCAEANPQPDENFRKTPSGRSLRGTCRECEAAQTRARRKLPEARPTPVVPPMWKDPLPPQPEPKDPLTETLEAHRASVHKRDVSRENRALIDELEKKDRLIVELSKTQASPQIVVYAKPSWERSDSICCAVASDWHVEEPVEGDSVHGVNEFNLDVAKQRAEFFFKHVLKLADKEARDANVKTIHLSLLGDFFSGWIHEELIANSLLAPGDAMLFVKGLLCSGIDFLLRESSYAIDGDCVPGNHGRMTRQMHFGDPSGTSLESVMYAHIVDRYSGNPRVRINNSGHAMIYRTFFEKFVLRLIHGYEVKYGGGVGGVTIPLNKAIAQWDTLKPATLTAYGHFHQYLPGPRSIGNGSLIGYNLFAQAIKAGFEEAQQAFFVINARNGGTRAGVFPVWLDDKHRQARTAA